MPAGRPTAVTPEVLVKLEYAFSIGCTDKEACLYADIAGSTLYDYQNLHPEFAERKEELKENPVLKARETIFKGLDKDDNAKWYLERKKKDEFAQRQEHTGDKGEPMQLEVLDALEDPYERLGQQAKGQVVETNPPLQDKE